MPAMKYINRIKALDQLIRLRATGNPKELSEKIGITERQMYKYIDNLKELGAKIKFEKTLNSYIYESNEELIISYKQKKV